MDDLISNIKICQKLLDSVSDVLALGYTGVCKDVVIESLKTTRFFVNQLVDGLVQCDGGCYD